MNADEMKILYDVVYRKSYCFYNYDTVTASQCVPGMEIRIDQTIHFAGIVLYLVNIAPTWQIVIQNMEPARTVNDEDYPEK